MRGLGLLIVLAGGCTQAPAGPAPVEAVKPPPEPDAPAAPTRAATGPWRAATDQAAGNALRTMSRAVASPGVKFASIRDHLAEELCFGDDDSDLQQGGVTSGLRCARGAAVQEAADQIIAQLKGLGPVECADSMCVARGQGLESWYALRARGDRVHLVGIFEREVETTDDRAWEGEDRHAAWRAAIEQRFGKTR